MGKINYTNLSPGDPLTNTSINTTTQEFANQTATLQNENFRDQGLDVHNFQRGLLNRYSGLPQPHLRQQDDFDISKNIEAKSAGWNEEDIFLTTVQVQHSPPLDLTPDENGNYKYSIITRFGFDCFIDWFDGTVHAKFGADTRGIIGQAYLVIRATNDEANLEIRTHVNEIYVFYISHNKIIRFGRGHYPTQAAFEITNDANSLFTNTQSKKIISLNVDLYFNFNQSVDTSLVKEFLLQLEGNLQVQVLGT